MKKSELTKQKILDTAIKFLWSNSFREMSIAALTSNAQISRTCFYRYFRDRHNLMEVMLKNLEQEISIIANEWFTADEEPAKKLVEAIKGYAKVCYERGPLLRAIYEAAPMDERLEKAWNDFLKVFDNAVAARIEKDQKAGLVPNFDAYHIAIALNRMDVGVLIHHFGRNPRSDFQPVYESMARVWVTTIYSQEFDNVFPRDK